MVGEIKTLEERKNKLLAKGKKQGFITYEQLAEELKGLEVDSDSLDDLYNALVEEDGCPGACIKIFDSTVSCKDSEGCLECKKKFWLTPIEEEEE